MLLNSFINYRFFLVILVLILSCSECSAYYKMAESDSIRYYLQKGDYETAKQWLLKIEDSIPDNNDTLKIDWLFDYSVITAVLREYDSSFSSLMRASAIAKQINDLPRQQKIQIQTIEWYRIITQYDKARKFIWNVDVENIASVSEKCRFYHRSAAVYNELHYFNINLNSYLDTALQFALKAKKIAEEYDLESYKATIYNELGNIYEKQVKNKLSLNFYNKAIEIHKRLNYLDYINSIKNLGGFYLRNKEYDSAITKFNIVISHIDSAKHDLIRANTYWGLKFAFFGKGDTIEGLKYAVKEAEANLKVSYIEQKRRLLEVSVEYETKEKDLLLQNANKKVESEKSKNRLYLNLFIVFAIMIIALSVFTWLINKRNKQLKLLMNENQFLIGEANHRIKNNLQLIISLIGREIYNSKGRIPVLNKLSDKINTIAALHQQLYLKNAKDTISVKDYVENIYENFKEGLSIKDLVFEMEIDEIDLKVEKAVYLGLLITELITNSLKYAFENRVDNFIGLKIYPKNKDIYFLYIDNGPGLGEDKNPKLVNLLKKQLESETLPYNHEGYSIYLKFKL